jgi:hypothetical protein
VNTCTVVSRVLGTSLDLQISLGPKEGIPNVKRIRIDKCLREETQLVDIQISYSLSQSQSRLPSTICQLTIFAGPVNLRHYRSRGG